MSSQGALSAIIECTVTAIAVTAIVSPQSALARGIKELKDGRPFVIDVVAERVGLLADSTWYPKYSIAERRTKQI